MSYFKSCLLVLFVCIGSICQIIAQQSYIASANKFTTLIDTKMLKNGDLVLVEKISYCQGVNIKIKKEDGSENSILNTGNPIFISFNELPDNNWLLIFITDNSDDVPTPLEYHAISFIDGDYNITSLQDFETNIDFEKVSISAVINSNELVLIEENKIYFTDFALSNPTLKELSKNIIFLKSPLPDDTFLYYQYANEDKLYQSENKLDSEQLLAFDLGPEFRGLYYLDDYSIFHDENELSYLLGIFEFDYLEQGTKIYNFRQHGQNLTYHTLSSDSILSFNKISLDSDGLLLTEKIDIDINNWNQVPLMHWDGSFRGLSYNFLPLSTEIKDEYRGFNYILNYNFSNNNLESQYSDISIEDISYTTAVDTIVIDEGIFEYRVDVAMQISIANNSTEVVNNFNVHSTAFEGINCAHNRIKIDTEGLQIEPNQTIIIDAKYDGFIFNNLNGLNDGLCIYAIGANSQPDLIFDDNIFCLPFSELTSTNEELAVKTLNAYPNPAQSTIQIENDNLHGVYFIYDMQGNQIAIWDKKRNNHSFDISNLNSGHYLIVDHQSNSRTIFMKM